MMSPDALRPADRGVEATFVAGPTIRTGRLALWHRGSLRGRRSDLGSAGTGTDGSPPGASGEGAHPSTVALLVPTGARIRRQVVPVTWLEIPEAIDELLAVEPGAARPSVTAWAHATRMSLHLIARGRLLPTADTDGCDLWRSGPLDADDLADWTLMADALPADAHASEVPGSAPRRMSSPTWLLARYRDAVVDTYVRTRGAAESVGHVAFASTERVTVAGSASWLVAAGSGADASVSVSLRLDGDARPLLEGSLDEGPPGPSFRATVVVTSRRDPGLSLDAEEVWRAPTAVAARFGDDVEDHVLLALRRGSRVWRPLGRLLDSPAPDAIDLDPDEVEELLGPDAPDLAAAGVDLLLPAGSLEPLSVSPRIVAEEAIGSDRSAGLSLDGLCELRWVAAIDGEALDEDEIAQLVEAKRSVIRLRGRWVRVDPSKIARLRERRRLDAGRALAAAIDEEIEIDGDIVAVETVGPIADLAAKLRRAGERVDVEPPPDLRAELRPYQLEGLAWLASMAELGLGGILADDMGLGKTVQLLALHLHRRRTIGPRPTLVVCPLSVVANWEREARRFAPDVPVRRFSPGGGPLADLEGDAIVIVTYGVVRRNAEVLSEIDWGLVAADEAQNMKNPRSRTARAMRSIRADARFALTGTPVENRLLDLWALLDWTTPGLLGSHDRFRREIAGPIERGGDATAAEMLARVVRPFTLRRRKIDPGIAPELPPKTETDEVVGLTAEQATLYAAMVEEVMAEVETAEGIARRGLVLKLLGGLKQICNHPAQFLRQPGPLASRSGKLEAVDDLIDVIVDEGESVLVFTQYVSMGELLVTHLGRTGRKVEFLHGSVSAAARQDMVDRFQAGDVPILVISLRAGGTGLNLTRATHVIHYDRWWNPAVEDQASDRAWRIGQYRPVQVHRMICEGTVEDRVAALLVEKRALAESVVGGGEAWIGDLSDADLRDLVALGAEP